ncbi:hypothetical protein GF319_01250 [Candidatus Bathyarchaeota archaeon]|nr:hypothetical protein [Candidatus Bathyarchaeota archaeon]
MAVSENIGTAEYIFGLYEEYGFEDPNLESFKFLGCSVGGSILEVACYEASVAGSVCIHPFPMMDPSTGGSNSSPQSR